MDWTFAPGIDLKTEPVVTPVEGGELRSYPGCRVFVPGPLGDAEVASAMPNGCRSYHGAIQEPVERLLTDLWPQIADCRTAKQLGAVILTAGVDPKLKHALGRVARDRLGVTWTDGTVRFWLAPEMHSAARVKKQQEAVRRSSLAWLSVSANQERRLQTKAAWRKTNPNYANQYARERYQEDAAFSMAHRLRGRLAKAVKAAGTGKAGKTMDLVGCTPQELKAWIESQFVDGMTWENRAEWHLDHIRPLASFDLTDPTQQAASMHFTNLKPVWAADNLKKGSLHEGTRHRYRKPE